MLKSNRFLLRLTAIFSLFTAALTLGSPIGAQPDFSKQLEALKIGKPKTDSEHPAPAKPVDLNARSIGSELRKSRSDNIAAEKAAKIAAIGQQCRAAQNPVPKPSYPSASLTIYSSVDCGQQFRDRFGHATPDRSGWIRACNRRQEDNKRAAQRREASEREIEFERRKARYASQVSARQRQVRFCRASRNDLAAGILPAGAFPAWEKNDETRFLSAMRSLETRTSGQTSNSDLAAKTREQERVVARIDAERKARAQSAEDSNAALIAKLAADRNLSRRIAQCQAAIDKKYPGPKVVVEGRDCTDPSSMSAQAFEVSCSCAANNT